MQPIKPAILALFGDVGARLAAHFEARRTFTSELLRDEYHFGINTSASGEGDSKLFAPLTRERGSRTQWNVHLEEVRGVQNAIDRWAENLATKKNDDKFRGLLPTPFDVGHFVVAGLGDDGFDDAIEWAMESLDTLRDDRITRAPILFLQAPLMSEIRGNGEARDLFLNQVRHVDDLLRGENAFRRQFPGRVYFFDCIDENNYSLSLNAQIENMANVIEILASSPLSEGEHANTANERRLFHNPNYMRDPDICIASAQVSDGESPWTLFFSMDKLIERLLDSEDPDTEKDVSEDVRKINIEVNAALNTIQAGTFNTDKVLQSVEAAHEQFLATAFVKDSIDDVASLYQTLVHEQQSPFLLIDRALSEAREKPAPEPEQPESLWFRTVAGFQRRRVLVWISCLFMVALLFILWWERDIISLRTLGILMIPVVGLFTMSLLKAEGGRQYHLLRPDKTEIRLGVASRIIAMDHALRSLKEDERNRENERTYLIPEVLENCVQACRRRLGGRVFSEAYVPLRYFLNAELRRLLQEQKAGDDDGMHANPGGDGEGEGAIGKFDEQTYEELLQGLESKAAAEYFDSDEVNDSLKRYMIKGLVDWLKRSTDRSDLLELTERYLGRTVDAPFRHKNLLSGAHPDRWLLFHPGLQSEERASGDQGEPAKILEGVLKRHDGLTRFAAPPRSALARLDIHIYNDCLVTLPWIRGLERDMSGEHLE